MSNGGELVGLKRLSMEVEPEQKGPAVGERVSSQRLTEEYSNADPIYASKTKSLPETYPEYRTIKGDGTCGFRAIAFGYFEALLRNHDTLKLQSEAKRLNSLSSLLDETGQDSYLYTDWVDETLALLEQLTTLPSEKNPESVLFEAFRVSDTADSITQHFRMITSAWMKTHPDEYAPFVPDMDVQTYCQNHVDPFYEEIEHVGVKALVDSVVNPAGIAVECLYLDRSAGSEATRYSFPATDEIGNELQGAPAIRLLYRPGHYDLLYQENDRSSTANISTRSVEANGANTNDIHVRMMRLPETMQSFQSFDTCGLPGIDPNATFASSDTVQSQYYHRQHEYLQYSPTTSEGFEPGLESPTYSSSGASSLCDYQVPEAHFDTTAYSLYGNSSVHLGSRASAPIMVADEPSSAVNTRRNSRISGSISSSQSPPPNINPLDSLNWSPITQEQREYDERLNSGSCPTSSSGAIQQPLSINKKGSPVARAPAHFKQDGEKFKPKIYDGLNDAWYQ